MKSSVHKIQRDIDLVSCSGRLTAKKEKTSMEKYREWMYPAPKEKERPIRPNPPEDKVEEMYPNLFNKHWFKGLLWACGLISHAWLCYNSVGFFGEDIGIYVFYVSLIGVFISAAMMMFNLEDSLKEVK